MRKITLLLAVFITSISGKAQEGKSTFSLFEAQDYAMNNAEKIKNSGLDIAIAAKKIVETRAIGLPQVTIDGTFQNFLNLPVQVVGANFIDPTAPADATISFKAGTDYSAAGNLKVNQILFNGSYIVGLQFSKFYAKMAESQASKTQEDILYNVTQAYQMVVVAKNNLKFTDSLVLITSELIEKQRNFLELGMMQQEDMDQLEYSLLGAKNNQTEAKIQWLNAQALLKMTMAFPQEDNLDVTASVQDLIALSSNMNSSVDLNNNLNFILLSQQKTLHEFELKNKRYLNLPVANAFFQHTYNAYRNKFNFFSNDEKWFPQTFWGIQVSIPVFASGSRWAQIEQAKLVVMKDENNINEFQRTLKMQEIQAKNKLTGAQEKLLLQEANIRLAKKIFDNAMLRKEIGNGNSILVTQKYNQLIVSQAQYIGAVLEVLNARLDLDRLYSAIPTK